MKVDARSLPCSPFQKCVNDFLPCGFELTSHPWAVGLGRLIYLTARICELPDLHCLHLRLDLLHSLLNRTLLRLSAWTSNPSLSSRSACTSLLVFNPPIASLQNPTGG